MAVAVEAKSLSVVGLSARAGPDAETGAEEGAGANAQAGAEAKARVGTETWAFSGSLSMCSSSSPFFFSLSSTAVSASCEGTAASPSNACMGQEPSVR